MSPSKMNMFLEGNEKIITPEKSGWVGGGVVNIFASYGPVS